MNSVLAKRYELLDELIYWNYGIKLVRNESVSLNFCNASLNALCLFPNLGLVLRGSVAKCTVRSLLISIS